LIGEVLTEKEQARLREALAAYNLPIDGIEIIQGRGSDTYTPSAAQIEATYQRFYLESQRLQDSLRVLRERLQMYEKRDTLASTLLEEIRVFFPGVSAIGLSTPTTAGGAPDSLYVVIIRHRGELPETPLRTWLEKRLSKPIQTCLLPEK
jgi:hypothetical protein